MKNILKINFFLSLYVFEKHLKPILQLDRATAEDQSDCNLKKNDAGMLLMLVTQVDLYQLSEVSSDRSEPYNFACYIK